MNKTINNNHKAAKSTKNFHVNENRKPGGWGGYTLKLSDIDNLFNYNVESREIRIAKIDINIYKRAKSHKLVKKDKKNDNTKKKGILSANSTNTTVNKTENNKDEIYFVIFRVNEMIHILKIIFYLFVDYY